VLGEYLQYNAPHKMSLYLRCGLPLIVWEKAGLASFVKENRIGVCISSLADLDETLSAIGTEQYMEMKRNAERIAERISRGFYCLKAIGQCCADLGITLKESTEKL